MSKFDFAIPPQPRRADAGATKSATQLPDGSDGSGEIKDTLNFDTVLREAATANGAEAPSRELNRWPRVTSVFPTEGEVIDGSPKNDVDKVDLNAVGGNAPLPMEGAQADRTPLIPLIATALPQAPDMKLPVIGSTHKPRPALSQDTAPLFGAASDTDVLQAPTAAVARVAVLHRETHFKPTASGPTFAVATSAQNPDAASDQTDGLDATKPSQSAQSFETVLAARVGAERARGTDASAPTSAGSERTGTDASLPPAMLQRIASAIASEGETISGLPEAPLRKVDGTHGSLVIKSSDRAVRVLNLQLHPAELGVVTVKMRLAGDKLEMELHAQSEDTAQLLRKDSEKLSALLRGSGYRPDVLAIHAPGDSAPSDGSQQRQQGQSSQSLFSGSHQGMAGSDSGSRGRSGQRGVFQDAGRQNADDEKGSLVDRNGGGLYL